ncbi:MAG: hypothetical protein HZB51_25200 [Chloroflexi bacterium]|nr:hypothetical protein [Chloroflexota bacterium]
MEHKTKPNWWIPFSFVPLMIVALLIESQFKYALEVHEIVDSGIVIATFGLMVGWVRINAVALEEADHSRERWVFIEEPSDAETLKLELPEESISEPTHMPAIPHSHPAAGSRRADIVPNKGRYN